MNDGQFEWPHDTYFIFSGHKNQLNVPEEIFIGEVPALESIGIQIQIKVPEDALEDRYCIEYEFRHQLQTQIFGGSSIKFTLLVDKSLKQDAGNGEMRKEIQQAEDKSFLSVDGDDDQNQWQEVPQKSGSEQASDCRQSPERY